MVTQSERTGGTEGGGLGSNRDVDTCRWQLTTAPVRQEAFLSEEKKKKKNRSKHISSVEYTEVSFSVKRKKTIEYLQSKKGRN